MGKPRRIAVLGGGLSAMTTVYTLMQEPNWKEKYDITIYQLGWRIGGKGASGVNPEAGYRIEEHGLHLWMGFYENAFRLIKDVYKGLNRDKSAPLSSFDKAFSQQDYFIFTEQVKDKWVDWKVPFPKLPGKVGDGELPSVENVIASISDFVIDLFIEWLEGYLLENQNKKWTQKVIDQLLKVVFWKETRVTASKKDFISKLRQRLSRLDDDIIDNVRKNFIKTIDSKELQYRREEEIDYVFTHWDKLKNFIWKNIGKATQQNDVGRRAWMAIDLGLSLLKGMVKDQVITINNDELHFDFEAINDIDYGEWLEKHGADRTLTVGSPIVRSMYDGPFSFLKGNPDEPNVEAGTILNIFLRLLFTCKESVVWRMNAGMGDVIFSPFYEDLVQKKKDIFKFFHAVRDVSLSDDKTSIERIVLGRQVTLKTDEYSPLVNVKGLDCWPSRPLYDQIVDEEAEELKEKNIHLESCWTEWEDRETIILKKGEDFDDVIFGFSVGTVPHVAKELLDHSEKWSKMIESIKTVQTQAYQYWFNQSAEELGIEEDKLQSAYVEPVDTFCAMNQVLDKEDWPTSHDPKYVAYSCGVFSDAEHIPSFDDHDFPRREKLRGLENCREYIEKHLSHLIPSLYDDEGNFNWDALVDLQDRVAEERIHSIYTRVNIDPSERYVLSAVNSSKYRIKTNDTDFENLFVTGDWIQNGMNAGFVEGAVTSGLLTAKAISDEPEKIPIITDNWSIKKLEKDLIKKRELEKIE
ncbi:NAD(P)-binding protein [Flammeovirga sp. SubArs3]|uniref:NAD(P)-binding protein n=1 Tax=Flammeovirga sp. SubArs3 TaxID=2995316 RepID=UPI00248AA87E|nr:NAD(P)-binding protein [Flammeovirga sp. SubArs3]